MTVAAIPYTFANGGGNADATQVMANLNAILTFLNSDAIQKDASVAFTHVPSGPATDPTTANQLTRKGYVDAKTWGTAAIADAAITSAKIADANVTTAKIADAAVTSAKIADGAIVTGDLADGAVTTIKVADGNVTNAKLAASTVDYTKLAAVPKLRLRRNAVQTQGAGQFNISWDATDANTHSFGVAGATVTIPSGMGGMYSIGGRFTASVGLSGNSYAIVTAGGVPYTHYVTTGNNNGAYHFTGLLGDGATVVVSVFNPSGTVDFQGNLEMVRIGT